jgi:peptidoglycan/LPS O-acetylase OafA/YrhL
LFSVPSVLEGTFQPIGSGALFSNLALVQNITNSPSIVAPLWSLPWEVQMYVALPFLYLGLLKSRPASLIIGLWAVSIVLRSAAIALSLSGVAYYVEFVPCFLAGAIAFQLGKRPSARFRSALWPMLIISSLVAFAGLWTWNPILYGRPIKALLSYALCAVLGFSLHRFRELPKTYFTHGCSVVAKYSYGIYLFHSFAVYLAFYKVASPPLQWLTLITLMIVLPWIAYQVVEAPTIRLGRFLAARLACDSHSVAEALILSDTGTVSKIQDAEPTYR